NSSLSDASGVTLSEVTMLEPGVTVDSVVASAGTSFAGSAGTGTWAVGTLAAGASATLTLTLTVGASASAGSGVISATATLSGVAEGDSDPSNDAATKPTSVPRQVDLAVSTTGPASVVAGSGPVTLLYALPISNSSLSDASGVTLSEVMALEPGVTVD